eukprot:s6266_g5.t1
MAALAWIPSKLSRSGLRWILLAVAALLALAWERRRRLTRALTAQISVALSSPYARQAVLAAARHLRIPVVDAAACQWADFAEMDWDAFLSQGPSLRRASSCEGVLPASFVVDLEDEQEFRALVCCGSVGGEWMGTILWQGAASLDVQMLKDLQLLPERFRKWAAAQTTKCDGILC